MKEQTVIVTDLTRFTNPDIVCTAMIDVDSGQCIRPMPYFKTQDCKNYNIQPGAIFTGKFTNRNGAEYPHTEDSDSFGLKFHGAASSHDFRNVLTKWLSPSISHGFNYQFNHSQKHVDINARVQRSIITIQIHPHQIRIHEDQFKPGKVKLSFTDFSGHEFNYLPITDLGFHNYAMKHQNDGALYMVQNFISRQDEVFLRIGLSRSHQVGDRNGYWLQVNGIYTFPEFNEDIRRHD